MLGRIITGAGALALALFLAWWHGNARYQEGMMAERAEANASALKAERVHHAALLAQQQRVTRAAGDYAARAAALTPVIVHSTKEVLAYAQTPAGRAACLAADRVRDINASAAALGLSPAADPGPAAAPLPAQPDPDQP